MTSVDSDITCLRRREGGGNAILVAERFEDTLVQPDDETSTCRVTDNAVVRADAGAAGSPRGLRCERYIPAKIGNSPGRAAHCGEWRVLRDFERKPLSERNH